MIAFNHRVAASTAAMIVAILAAGCTGAPSTRERADEPATTGTTTTPAAPTAAPTVEQAREAGVVARAIEAEPNRAEEILAQHGMTPESFDNLILEIARDPQLSQAYEEARTGSSG